MISTTLVRVGRRVAKVEALRSFVSKVVNVTYRAKIFIFSSFVPPLYAITKKMNMTWPSLAEAQANLCYVEFKRMLVSRSLDMSAQEHLFHKTLSVVEHAIALNPHFLMGARIAQTISLMFCEKEIAKEWVHRWHGLRKQLWKEKGIEGLGISFVPSGPLSKTIGTTAVYEAYIKTGILGLRHNTKLVMLLRKTDRSQFVNPHLLKYWRKYITIIDDPVLIKSLNPIEHILSASDSDPIAVNGRGVVFLSALAYANKLWGQEQRPPLFSLTPEDRKEGLKTLAEMGLGPEDWFVCLHVREGGFRGSEPFREADISTYTDAIRAVTGRGGWVIRMGDDSMTSLPEMVNVIDYAHSVWKSALMDVFLCGACRFFIGTSSGLYTVAGMFGVPIVQTNYLPTSTIFFAQNSLFLPKLLRSNQTGELLEFKHFFGGRGSICSNEFAYDEILNVTPVDNAPDELEAVVIEMIDQLDGVKHYTPQEKALQESFLNLTAELETLICLPGVSVNARMGQHFLNRYHFLLNAM